MPDRPQRYRGERLTITYERARCIHAAECVRGLPAVFDSARRPWVAPDGAEADAVAAVIERCPTGALRYHRHDGGPPERPDARCRVTPVPAGPLHVRGDVAVLHPDGTVVVAASRLALCRCGASQNKPFCDNRHRQIGFADPGAVAGAVTAAGAAGPVRVTLAPDGPLLFAGPVEIGSAAGEVGYRGEKAALCRCGGSANKPFCDGAHKRNGFTA